MPAPVPPAVARSRWHGICDPPEAASPNGRRLPVPFRRPKSNEWALLFAPTPSPRHQRREDADRESVFPCRDWRQTSFPGPHDLLTALLTPSLNFPPPKPPQPLTDALTTPLRPSIGQIAQTPKPDRALTHPPKNANLFTSDRTDAARWRSAARDDRMPGSGR